MSLLLALAGAVAPPAPPETVPGGGGGARWRSELTAKREPWRDELDRLFAKPIQKVQKPKTQEPRRAPVDVGLTRRQRAYFDALYARLIESINAQERAKKAAAIAQAEDEARAAIAMMLQAQADEALVRQQMRDFDIVFVAAVLAVS